MTNRTAAAKLAVCKWIRDQVGKWEDRRKPNPATWWRGIARRRCLQDTKIGTVTMCEGKRGFRVIDDNRLAEWVGGDGGRKRSSTFRASTARAFCGSWPTAR